MSVYDVHGNPLTTDTNLTSSFVEAISANGDKLNIQWEQGSLSTSNGATITSTTRVRTVTYYGFDSIRYLFIHCPDGYKFGIRRYNAVKTPTYIDASAFMTGNQIISDAEGKLYKFILAYANDDTIAPANVPSDFYCVPVYLPIWSKDANGHSVEAYTTVRNNPTLVQELYAVAHTYYDNRNDKHDGVWNMVYDNDNTIFDHPNDVEYTNGIDCSTFVGLCLRGIPYQDTSYYTLTPKPGVDYRANPQYSWSQNPFDYDTLVNRTSGIKQYSRNTGQIAQWLISQRREVKVDPSFVNIDVGDVVFWSRNTGVNPMNMYRFLHINHIAIVISKYEVLPYDSSKTYATGDRCQYNNALYRATSDISTPEAWTSSHWTKEYDAWDYEKLPYCHYVMESTTGNPTIQMHLLERAWDTPTNLTQNNYNTLSLVCRPDLGSL